MISKYGKIITASMLLFQTVSSPIILASEAILTNEVNSTVVENESVEIIDYVTEAGSRTTLQGYNFAISGNEAIITSYVGDESELQIPSIIKDGGKEYRVTRIGQSAFQNKYSITSVVIPAGVKSIDDNAFSSASNLVKVVIPDSVTKIGKWAFAYCTSLMDIHLPNTLTKISYSMFYGSSNLKSIIIPEGVESIESFAFQYCTNLTEVKLPSTLKNINIYAFSGASNLSEVVFPVGLERIGSYAFEMTNLRKIVIPSGVQTIDGFAFSNIHNLELVIIHDGLQFIFEDVFVNSYGLQKVVFYGNAPYTPSPIFTEDLAGLKIYYPLDAIGYEENWQGYPTVAMYPINYHGNGNDTGTSPVDGTTYINGDTLVLADSGSLEKMGYTFIGWNTQPVGTGEQLEPNTSVIADTSYHNLYAQWKVNEYQVTIDPQNGDANTIQNVKYSHPLDNLKTPQKEGFRFTGWFTDQELSIPWNFYENVITSDVTLYAGWEKYKAIENIEIIVPKREIYTHDEFQVEVEFTPNDLIDTSNIEWTSSDPSVATISNSGLVTALRSGTTTITLTVGEVTGSVELDVLASEITHLEIHQIALEIGLGFDNDFAHQLSASMEYVGNPDLSMTWSSTNEKVVKVDSNGNLTPVGAGESSIVVKVGDKTSETFIRVFEKLIKPETLTPQFSEVMAGYQTKITMEVDNPESVESVAVTYQESATWDLKEVILTYNKETGLFEGTFHVNESDLGGAWGAWEVLKIAQIVDSNYSDFTIYNTRYRAEGSYTFEEATIYSHPRNDNEITYDEISPISGARVYNHSTTLSNGFIGGDIYVGPDAVVVIDNVNVYGDIYVMGELIIRNSSFNYIYHGHSKVFATSWDGYWPDYPTRGKVTYIAWSIDGSIFNRFLSSDTVIDSLPFRMDNLRAVDGYLDIFGATLDVADLYFGGTYVDTSNEGRFILNDYYVGKDELISAYLYTKLGGTLSATYTIDHYVSAMNGIIHRAPSIHAEDRTIYVGEDVNLLAGVTAFDLEDGVLNDKVKVLETNLEIDKRGTYFVTYSVTDSLGAEATTSISVTVLEPKVLDVRILDDYITLFKGESAYLWYDFETQDYPSYEISWESSDTNIVSVDQYGNILGLSSGQATITLMIGDKTDTVYVTVIVPLESISLNKTELTMEKGQSEQLTLQVQPIDTSEDTSVVWTSSNEEVATVDENGNVVALQGGTAEITAQVGAYTVHAQVNVFVPIQSLSLNKSDFTLEKGHSEKLTLQINPEDTTEDTTVIWSSSDNEIVSVDSKGNVTALQGGTAEITAQVGVHTARAQVNVIVPIKSINLNKEKVSLEKGKTAQLTLQINPTDTTEDTTVMWSSSNSAVAAVDQNGNITALKPGSAKITAKVGNLTVEAEVEVIISIQSIALNKTELSLERGKSEQLTLQINPTDTTEDATAVWSSSNDQIVTVDQAGNITALAAGNAEITAQVGGKTVSATVSVKVPLDSISIKEGSMTLNKGESKQLTVEYNPTDTTVTKDVTWKTSDAKVATISKDGNVIAVGKGKATITAMVDNKEAIISIEVKSPLSEIDFDQDSYHLTVGNKQTVKVSYFPGDTTDSKEVVWSSSNENVATVDENGTILAVNPGTALITAKTGSVVKAVTVEVSDISVDYRTHIQNVGWQDSVSNGETSGTEGAGKRLEGIEIRLPDSFINGSIEYQTHVQSYGWLDWEADGSMSGTENEGKRLEAIRIRLTDKLAEEYDVYYRVHAESYGWLDWAKNGEAAGTEGLAKRLEAIQIQLVRKGKPAPGKTDRPYVIRNAVVSYTTHVEKEGWQDYVEDGAMSGTEGQGLRLEALKMHVSDLVYAGGIEYRTHIQNIGWQDWQTNDQLSGTEGQGLRLEALDIRLTGELAEHYDIYYRVHAESFGWLDWAKNGESAGTEGLALRLEGLEVVLVEKGGKAPGSTNRGFVLSAPKVNYTTHVQNQGWQQTVSDGVMSGTSGAALRLEGILMNVYTQDLIGGVEYRTHIQNEGWQDWKDSWELSGTQGKGLRLEGVEIRLTDEMARFYDVYYRVHAESYGWLGWAKNGESAGTEGMAKRLEGIEIQLVRKGGKAPGSTQGAFVTQ